MEWRLNAYETPRLYPGGAGHSTGHRSRSYRAPNGVLGYTSFSSVLHPGHTVVGGGLSNIIPGQAENMITRLPGIASRSSYRLTISKAL